MTIDRGALIARAKGAMESAYAPYSGYRVGACALMEDGTMHTGCNIENASYGLTICAERVAVAGAVASGKTKVIAVAVVGEKSPAWPCGACRQVINEFGGRAIEIIVAQAGKEYEATTLAALLPNAFGPESL